MKISITSDVHLTLNKDKAYNYLNNFLIHEEVISSDVIIFLGDIFDIMIGAKKQYFTTYKFFFDALTRLDQQGKVIYYVEGNHDFHLERLFKKLDLNYFKVIQGELIIETKNKTLIFMHGDDLDVDNTSYQKWKKIYTSGFMKFMVNHIIPYWVLHYLGINASEKSRNRKSPSFDYEKEKTNFRSNFEKFDKSHGDIFIFGHSHIQDEYEFEGKLYINHGFPRKTMQFLQWEDDDYKWINL